MRASPEGMPIEYGVYAASDANAMAKLLGEVFSRRDLEKGRHPRGRSASSFYAPSATFASWASSSAGGALPLPCAAPACSRR